MRVRVLRAVCALAFGLAAPAAQLACSSESVSSGDDATGGRREVPPPPTGDGGDDAGAQPGSELRVVVGTDAPSYVSLGAPAVVEVDDPASSDAWDLAFQGWNVFTNGGISGGGQGWSFGPVAYYYLYFPNDPLDVPLKIVDHPGGAFLRWYAYGDDHGLFSRFHVYGVRSRGRLFKLQVLGYRGQINGVSINALYRVRYAEVSDEGEGELVDISNIDATANNDAANPDEPSTCLALATEEQLQLTPAEARKSEDWDLCFRRDVISVNGGVGGPGDVEAVDLDAAETDGESVDDVMKRTASGELARLEATSYDDLTAEGLDYRGDEATSAFSGRFYLEDVPRSANVDTAWLVAGPDGETRYFVAFSRFIDPSAESPGTVVLRVVPITSQ